MKVPTTLSVEQEDLALLDVLESDQKSIIRKKTTMFFHHVLYGRGSVDVISDAIDSTKQEIKNNKAVLKILEKKLKRLKTQKETYSKLKKLNKIAWVPMTNTELCKLKKADDIRVSFKNNKKITGTFDSSSGGTLKIKTPEGIMQFNKNGTNVKTIEKNGLI